MEALWLWFGVLEQCKTTDQARPLPRVCSPSACGLGRPASEGFLAVAGVRGSSTQRTVSSRLSVVRAPRAGGQVPPDGPAAAFENVVAEHEAEGGWMLVLAAAEVAASG